VDPAVMDVTYSLIDAGQEWAMALEAEGRPVPKEPVRYNIADGSRLGQLVRYNRVATNFFAAFDVPVLIGRHFTSADVHTNRVLINRKLAETIFGNDNPVGRHVKYVGRSREAFVDDDFGDRIAGMPPAVPLEQWFEIVGVVPDFPVNEIDAKERIYHPAAVGELFPMRIAIRVRSTDPLTFAGRLRAIAAAVNPGLAPRDITTTALIVEREQGIFRIAGITVGGAMLSVIILSAAGIYSLMSFTVAKRRREIGIRAALGANRNRLLLGIFSRALAQLGAGAALGALGAIGLDRILEGDMLTGQRIATVPLVAIVMTTVGVLASIGPARQGLSIQPTEALREE
jgi:putative ABC transport system permease protein